MPSVDEACDPELLHPSPNPPDLPLSQAEDHRCLAPAERPLHGLGDDLLPGHCFHLSRQLECSHRSWNSAAASGQNKVLMTPDIYRAGYTSARDLDRRLADLVRSERHLVVQFVVQLADFAKRELYRELRYTSLFYYCVRQLGLSKSSAFRRSEVLVSSCDSLQSPISLGRADSRSVPWLSCERC